MRRPAWSLRRASVSALANRRRSESNIPRVLKRCRPRSSFPKATSSGELVTLR